MKTIKVIKIATIALMMPLMFTACKRDYVCTCDSENALGVTSSQKYPLTNQNRIDANEACEKNEADNAWVKRDCHL